MKKFPWQLIFYVYCLFLRRIAPALVLSRVGQSRFEPYKGLTRTWCSQHQATCRYEATASWFSRTSDVVPNKISHKSKYMPSKGLNNMTFIWLSGVCNILIDTAEAAGEPQLHFQWSRLVVQARQGAWGPILLQWLQRFSKTCTIFS